MPFVGDVQVRNDVQVIFRLARLPNDLGVAFGGRELSVRSEDVNLGYSESRELVGDEEINSGGDGRHDEKCEDDREKRTAI
jgi:hypothetical protein